MKCRFSNLLVTSIFWLASCVPTSTPTEPPATEPVVPSDKNSVRVDGEEGIPGIPVQCEAGEGNIEIPPQSFSGEKVITIECLSEAEKVVLSQAVEDYTHSTGEAIGAIKLSPSGLRFNTDVIITIPLIQEVHEQYVSVYIYDDDSKQMYDEKIQARVECTGWCATVSVDHFSTFVVYEIEQVMDGDGPEIAFISHSPDSPWVCLEEIDRVSVSGQISDSSGVESAVVRYQIGGQNQQEQVMQADGETFVAGLYDLQEGNLHYWVTATDSRGNTNTMAGGDIGLFQCGNLQVNQELPGNDLPGSGGTLGINNLPACRQKCDNNPECRTYTFRPEDGACWLKSNQLLPNNNPGLVSEVRRPDEEPPEILDISAYPASGPACIQDYSQFSIRSTIRDNSKVSRAEFQFRFIPFDGVGTMESTTMSPQGGDTFSANLNISNGGELSYTIEAWDIFENHAQTYKEQLVYWDCAGLLFGTDLVGLDFGGMPTYVQVNNPQACRQRCSSWKDCMSFTYQPSDGACWLKSGEPLPTNDPAFISGVVIDDTSPPMIHEIEEIGGSCSASTAKIAASVSDSSGVSYVELWTYTSSTGGPWVSTRMYYNSGSGKYEADINLPYTGKVYYLVRPFDIHGYWINSDQGEVAYRIC